LWLEIEHYRKDKNPFDLLPKAASTLKERATYQKQLFDLLLSTGGFDVFLLICCFDKLLVWTGHQVSGRAPAW